MSFQAAFSDLYFSVPYAKGFLGGDSSPAQAPIAIQVIVTGTASGPGTTLSIYQSGKIDVAN